MSNLIPSYPLSKIRNLSGKQLRELKSCEVTVDGEYAFTIISPTTDYIKLQAEYLGQLGNSVGKHTLEEVNAPLPV